MRELKAHKIRRKIQELEGELSNHQERCKHIKATKKARANTGNWDSSDDSYWYVFDCPTCLKHWTEPQ